MADKARHAFGSEAKIAEALAAGKIDAYDILFLDEKKVGWINKSGEVIIAEPDLSGVEAEIATKANAEDVEALEGQIATKADASAVEAELASKANADDVVALDAKIAAKADKVRKEPLRCILNGLGKDAAMIISRINGFTYCQTEFDYATGEVKVVNKIAYSDGPRAKVNCYGADDVREGVAIMHLEGVDVSITGNSTNPTRFQHPVAGTYKKECMELGKKYFSVASGGGTGRTLHPDNMAAGPASYGMTDTMGRMHSDAQFAGSSSVPAHVEMMGFLGIGNNPMVGATVAIAVDIAGALSK